MMKRLNSILKLPVFFLLFATVMSCGKDGAAGPVGPAGERGEKGDQGTKGADGTLLRYGNGVPAPTLGNENDFYIDIKNSNLYGPKTGNSWGSPISLKGDTGAAGKDGSQFLSGTAVPTTQGKVGDFYFRTTTAVLYGPKTVAGWGAGIILRGDKGDKGDKGTANVIYSGWIVPTEASWNEVNLPRHKRMAIHEPKITRDILNHGMVLVYLRTNNGATSMLPTVSLNGSGATVLKYSATLRSEGVLWISVASYGQDIAPLQYLGTHPTMATVPGSRFRYVIIPGGVPTNLATGGGSSNKYFTIKGIRYSKHQIEGMSYEEVKKLIE